MLTFKRQRGAGMTGTAINRYDESPADRIVVLGNFDGVHRGHRHLIEHAIEERRRS
jgi:FAD synthase